jgi:catechol 2,3-dioxygenase-like lactoylglutathione lyase family enzyme
MTMPAFRYLVHDVDAAVAFYTQSLGFTLTQQYGPAMAILARDHFALWLAGPLASAAKPMPDGRKPEPGGWNRFRARGSRSGRPGRDAARQRHQFAPAASVFATTSSTVRAAARFCARPRPAT